MEFMLIALTISDSSPQLWLQSPNFSVCCATGADMSVSMPTFPARMASTCLPSVFVSQECFHIYSISWQRGVCCVTRGGVGVEEAVKVSQKQYVKTKRGAKVCANANISLTLSPCTMMRPHQTEGSTKHSWDSLWNCAEGLQLNARPALSLPTSWWRRD